MTSSDSSRARTTIHMMLTRTTLLDVNLIFNGEGIQGTHNPANVKMAVRIICCLVVVRRRHSSGIGCNSVSDHAGISYENMSYEDKHQGVEKDIYRTAPDEESIFIDTTTHAAIYRSTPRMVDRLTG